MRKGLIVGVLVVAVLAGGGYVAADYYANAKVEQQAERFARDMRKQVREFRYGSVKADLLGRAIVMKNVEIVTKAGERIKAESVAVKDFDWRNGSQPRYADLEIKGADLPTALLADLARASDSLGSYIGVSTGPVGEAQRLLERAGYKRTTSDLFVRYRYDEDTREFELRDVQLEIADLGQVTFSLRLGNMPSPGAARGGVQLLSTGAQATLVGASIAFKDRTLVSRLLKAHAAERKISEAEALARVLRDLKAERDRSRDAFEREALSALVRFIERPSEISLALAPAQPVPLLSGVMGFMSGRGLKDTFGLKIAAR